MADPQISQWANDAAHVADSIGLGNILSAIVGGCFAFFAARWSHKKQSKFVQTERELQRQRELTEKIAIILLGENERAFRLFKNIQTQQDLFSNLDSWQVFKDDVHENELSKAYSYAVLLNDKDYERQIESSLNTVRSIYNDIARDSPNRGSYQYGLEFTKSYETKRWSRLLDLVEKELATLTELTIQRHRNISDTENPPKKRQCFRKPKPLDPSNNPL